MLAEFSITPIGVGEGVSEYVAECLRIVAGSGLDYRINPMGTVVEGGFDEVMALITKCHKSVRKSCRRVSTIIKIDDREGATDSIKKKIESVEKKVGRKLRS